jgi:hypothetical protein
MRPAGRLQLSKRRSRLQRILTDRFQHQEAGAARVLVAALEQVLVEQGGQAIQHLDALTSQPSRHRLHCLKLAAPHENGAEAEESLFFW